MTHEEISIPGEKWLPLAGYESLYKISSIGRIWSMKYHTIFKSTANNYGYVRTLLYKNGVRKNVTVHRLVAQHFIPNPENKPFVNHINSVRHDNRVENLEWVTNAENIQHGYDYGFIIPPHQKPLIDTKTGERYPSIYSAARELKMCRKWLKKMLRGDKKNKTNLVYERR